MNKFRRNTVVHEPFFFQIQHYVQYYNGAFRNKEKKKKGIIISFKSDVVFLRAFLEVNFRTISFILVNVYR